MTKEQHLKFIDDYKEIVTLIYDIKELLDDHIRISETDNSFLISDKTNIKDRYMDVIRKTKPDIHSLLSEVNEFQYNFTRMIKDTRTYNSTELLPACVINEIFEKLQTIEKGLIVINVNK
jgi:hypothetical protein